MPSGGVYIKAGKVVLVDSARDRKIKSKHTRKRGSASWRGDAPGSRV